MSWLPPCKGGAGRSLDRPAPLPANVVFDVVPGYFFCP